MFGLTLRDLFWSIPAGSAKVEPTCSFCRKHTKPLVEGCESVFICQECSELARAIHQQTRLAAPAKERRVGLWAFAAIILSAVLAMGVFAGFLLQASGDRYPLIVLACLVYALVVAAGFFLYAVTSRLNWHSVPNHRDTEGTER